MTVHTVDHDPTVDHAECALCSQALGGAFAKLMGVELGPSTAERLIETIRRLAQDELARGAAA